jgi:flagellar hook-associated protein 3 FlgL
MVNRISTASQNLSNLRNLQTSSSAMALSTYQITTGLKSRTLSDDAGNANKLLTLRDVQTRTETYMTNLSSAEQQLKASESALQQMTDLLSEATSLATTARNENSASTRDTLAPKAQALVENFYSLFNTQYNGQYLFSGSNANVSPMGDSPEATAFGGYPLDTSWYQGDSQLATVVSGAQTTLEYGVTGDSDAFAQLKSGLEALWYGLENNNVTEIDNAISVLSSAKTSLSSMVSDIGGQMNSVTQQTDRYTTQQTFVTDSIDGVEKVDVSQAMIDFSNQQATLQASMMVINQMNQTSLLDYLR